MSNSLMRLHPANCIFTTASPQLVFTTGTNFPSRLLAFDASTDESVIYTGVMPQSYTSGSNVDVVFYWKTDTGTTGYVVWGAQCLGLADGETYDASLSTAISVVDQQQAASYAQYCTATFSAPSLAPGDLVVIKISRLASNTSDTYAADAHLSLVELRA